MDNHPQTQLYFHIGDHKTGSTSIQTALYQGAWDCETKRLEYPNYLSDVKLAKALYLAPHRSQRGPLLKAKADWLAGIDADVAVISAEHFSHVRPDIMHKALEQHLPSHAPTAFFLAYVRPHAPRILSGYAQNIKCGGFTKSLEDFHAHGIGRGFCNYSLRFSHWKEIFGERFILRPMVRDLLFKSDVVADLLNIVLDGAAFSIRKFAKVNESLTVQQLACMREVQLVLRGSDVPAPLRVGVGSHVGAALNAGGASKGDKIVLHRNLVAQIRAHYLSDAQELDRLFFTGSPMENAFDEAMAAAAEMSFCHELAAYANSADITTLRLAAQRIAKLMPNFGVAWRHRRLSAIGQRAPAWPDDPTVRAGVIEIDTCFDEICAVIGHITAQVS